MLPLEWRYRYKPCNYIYFFILRYWVGIELLFLFPEISHSAVHYETTLPHYRLHLRLFLHGCTLAPLSSLYSIHISGAVQNILWLIEAYLSKQQRSIREECELRKQTRP